MSDREKAKLYFSNILAFVVPVSLVILLITYWVLPIESPALKIWICIYFLFDIVKAVLGGIWDLFFGGFL